MAGDARRHAHGSRGLSCDGGGADDDLRYLIDGGVRRHAKMDRIPILRAQRRGQAEACLVLRTK